MFIEDLKLKMF